MSAAIDGKKVTYVPLQGQINFCAKFYQGKVV